MKAEWAALGWVDLAWVEEWELVWDIRKHARNRQRKQFQFHPKHEDGTAALKKYEARGQDSHFDRDGCEDRL